MKINLERNEVAGQIVFSRGDITNTNLININ